MIELSPEKKARIVNLLQDITDGDVFGINLTDNSFPLPENKMTEYPGNLVVVRGYLDLNLLMDGLGEIK